MDAVVERENSAHHECERHQKSAADRPLVEVALGSEGGNRRHPHGDADEEAAHGLRDAVFGLAFEPQLGAYRAKDNDVGQRKEEEVGARLPHISQKPGEGAYDEQRAGVERHPREATPGSALVVAPCGLVALLCFYGGH